MGMRERLQLLRKVFGPAEPAAIRAGEEAAGMTPSRPFSPGEPIGPYDGYSRNPRTREIITGYNINARPRAHERVPFDTLRSLIEAYDVASMAIWHRIDSLRALEWSLVAADGYEHDVADAITIAKTILKSPDHENDFSSWLAAFAYDILAYDAGTLYRIRNRLGQTVGLRVVDGTMIAPLQDYWGNVPAYPAEAYVQYANGLPWNWLTTRDLIYRPFRKITRSPYGQAPMETILLNANTDLRFQAHFLQYFTQGNIPAAFAGAPESWSPNQIEQFQTYWDAYILGDQAAKSQIKWIPGGSQIEFTHDKEFSDAFSLHLMRKTAAAYHVVPSDLGFTQEINKSSGETQSDVQHRVGDVPLAKHIARIITSFLQDDLHLPVKFQFDFGEEQDDRLQTAQADKIYFEIGAVGASEIRQMRYGLNEAGTYTVPRVILSSRSGPIPLGALDAVAGAIDPGTAGPALNTSPSRQVFRPVQGVLPVPPIEAPPLAAQIYGPSALPPAPVGKEGVAPGITAATGIYSYDLAGRGHHTASDGDEDEPETDPVAKAADAEIAAFRRHVKQTRRPGRKWRDFQFTNLIDPATAHRLNDGGRLAWRKAAGQIAVAGLAVQAADTGRVLMLQRALDNTDPAGGTFEFPGGHLEGGETASEAAVREWSEETGLALPHGESTGTWTSGDGIYQGFAYRIATENDLDIFDRDELSNPDDPDGDRVETIAWWDPAQLPGNPAVRPELLASIDDVLAALATGIAKAGAGAGPKVKAGPATDWPGWQHDHRAANHWGPKIGDALTGALPPAEATSIAAGFLDAHPGAPNKDTDRKALIAAALLYLTGRRTSNGRALVDALGAALAGALIGVIADGYLIGTASAQALLGNTGPVLPGWEPGDTDDAKTRIEQLGTAVGLGALLGAAEAAARRMATTRLNDLARTLADAAIQADGSTEAGRALRAMLADASRNAAIAITEISSASGEAAFNVYRQHDIAWGRWVTDPASQVCHLCYDNEEAGPIPLGQRYPSGATNTPQHNHCRCAVVASDPPGNR